MFRGFDLGRIFLVKIAQRHDVFVPIERVVVEVHFRVQRDHLAAAGEDQRIDLHQRRVGFPESLVQTLENRARFRHAGIGNADPAR